MNSYRTIGVLLLSLVAEALAVTYASAHEVGLQIETGVGASYIGSYPYAPLTLPDPGAFNIPQKANLVGGLAYDCAKILDQWNVLAAKKMYGVAVYRDVDGVIRGVHTRSGESMYPPPSNPPDIPAYGAVASWEAAVAEKADRDDITAKLASYFAYPRKCFGFPRGAAFCAYDAAATRIVRNWVPHAPPIPPALAGAPVATPERGALPGVCALTRIAIHLRNKGIHRNSILCAAQRTDKGWGGGKDRNGLPIAYGHGEIVSSCVTCQQQVPIILGAICKGVAAPANGAMGTCLTEMLEGENCAFSCSHGAAIPATTSCVNGAMTPSVCPAAPPVAHVVAPIVAHAVAPVVAHAPAAAAIAVPAAIAHAAPAAPVVLLVKDSASSFKRFKKMRQRVPMQP